MTNLRLLVEGWGWISLPLLAFLISSALTELLSIIMVYFKRDLIVAGRLAFYAGRRKDHSVPRRFVTDMDDYYWDHVYDRFYWKSREVAKDV